MMEARRFRLRSGRTVLIRPIRSDDAPALAAAVEQLSEQSRYRRFHSHMRRLDAQMLTYLTEIDHHDQLTRRAGEVGIEHFTAEMLAEDTPTLALVGSHGDADLTRLGGQHMTRRAAADGHPDHMTGDDLP